MPTLFRAAVSRKQRDAEVGVRPHRQLRIGFLHDAAEDVRNTWQDIEPAGKRQRTRVRIVGGCASAGPAVASTSTSGQPTPRELPVHIRELFSSSHARLHLRWMTTAGGTASRGPSLHTSLGRLLKSISFAQRACARETPDSSIGSARAAIGRFHERKRVDRARPETGRADGRRTDICVALPGQTYIFVTFRWACAGSTSPANRRTVQARRHLVGGGARQRPRSADICVGANLTDRHYCRPGECRIAISFNCQQRRTYRHSRHRLRLAHRLPFARPEPASPKGPRQFAASSEVTA